jgi:hypothetical protein
VILEAHSAHTNPLISETCVISIARIKESLDKTVEFTKSPYTSVDPAPAETSNLTLAELETIMLDVNVHLYTRYKVCYITASMIIRQCLR